MPTSLETCCLQGINKTPGTVKHKRTILLKEKENELVSKLVKMYLITLKQKLNLIIEFEVYVQVMINIFNFAILCKYDRRQVRSNSFSVEVNIRSGMQSTS